MLDCIPRGLEGKIWIWQEMQRNCILRALVNTHLLLYLTNSPAGLWLVFLNQDYIINCLKVFFSAGSVWSAAAWQPVNCVCVPQLFQELINTTLCPAFLRKFICQPLCCVPL